MSETQRNLFNNRRAGDLWITGAFILLAIVCMVSVPSPPELEPVEVSGLPRDCVRQVTPGVFDAETFKRMIIDNNLFRPLGWRPSRSVEPYRLIGTILPRSANTPPKAILQTTAGNQTYIVTLGDKFDGETEIVEIQPKQVTLSSKGQQRLLFLNAARWLQ